MPDAKNDPFESLTPKEFLEQKVLPLLAPAIRFAFLRRRQSLHDDDLARWQQRLYLHLSENNYRRLLTFNHDAELQTWLQRVTSNEISRELKQERQKVSLEKVPPEKFHVRPTQEDALRIKEEWHLVMKAIKNWPVEDQEFICLCLQDEMPAKEIAQQFGITPTAVRKRKERLLEKLHRRFGR